MQHIHRLRPPGAPDLHLVYSDPHYLVWAMGEVGNPIEGAVCVNFSSRGSPVPRVFGLPFTRKLGRPAFFVQARSNNWYQPATIFDALAAIRHAAGINRLVTYGSSMGGFAALAFAADLNAVLAIAISPQVSIENSIVGSFEPRWREEAATIRFNHGDLRPRLSSHPVPSILIHDPHHRLDNRHAQMILGSEGGQVSSLPVPLAGHPASYALAFGSVLSTLIRRALCDQIPAYELLQLTRRDYRRSPARKYVIALGLDLLRRRNQTRHSLWTEELTERHPVAGHRMTMQSLRELVALG